MNKFVVSKDKSFSIHMYTDRGDNDFNKYVIEVKRSDGSIHTVSFRSADSLETEMSKYTSPDEAKSLIRRLIGRDD